MEERENHNISEKHILRRWKHTISKHFKHMQSSQSHQSFRSRCLRQRSSQEVHKYVSQSLQIVPSSLFDAHCAQTQTFRAGSKLQKRTRFRSVREGARHTNATRAVTPRCTELLPIFLTSLWRQTGRNREGREDDACETQHTITQTVQCAQTQRITRK